MENENCTGHPYNTTTNKSDDKTISLFTSDEMCVAFGSNPVMHAALLDTKAAEGFLKTTYKLISYRDDKHSKHGEMTAQAVKEVQ